ncbi:MAG: TylF/MycF/NovP-related O-methyltransferase [Cyanobacteria bacterium J06555_13]
MANYVRTLRHSASAVLLATTSPPIIRAVVKDALTYLGRAALNNLHKQVKRVEKESVPGIFIEAGCALGGSAIVIATAKAQSRALYIYDVFGMIPPPSDKDDQDVHDRYADIKSGKSGGLGNDKYYGYEENLMDKVSRSFVKHNVPTSDYNVHLVQGLFQDTIHISEPVALAHIDGDWYDSVKVCLERIAPHLAPGGVLIIDDYEHWSGCRKAIDEYFADKMDQYQFDQGARLNIIRKSV